MFTILARLSRHIVLEKKYQILDTHRQRDGQIDRQPTDRLLPVRTTSSYTRTTM